MPPSSAAPGTQHPAPGTAPGTQHQAPGSRRLPPGPRLSALQRLVYWPGRNMLEFIRDNARTYGDLVTYRLGGELVFLVSDPNHIKDILVTHNRNFTKSRGLERTKRLLGNGLLTSEGATHLRQRRLMQPAFHRERIAGYGRTMAEYADRTRTRWTDGATLDVAQEMMRLTLSIAGKTLFDVDIERQAAEVGRAMNDVMESFWTSMLPFPDLLERMPIPRLRRARAARGQLDAIIYGMIAERRASGRDHGDLLSMLLNAQDEDDGGGMTDKQVRDEAMTILLAGHETTANALSWALHLLARSPVEQERLAKDPDGYASAVWRETMRLYPPAWVVARRLTQDRVVCGQSLAAGSMLLLSPWVVHRDPRWWPEPETFRPDRWLTDDPERARYAYFPFGGGPRQCIGNHFADLEGTLVLGAVARRWRLAPTATAPVPQPLVTLRPRDGVLVNVSRTTD